MKVKVLKVRIWAFIQQKRGNGISLMAKLFGKKSGRGEVLAGLDHLEGSMELDDSDGEFEFVEEGTVITKGETGAVSSLRRSFSRQQEEGPAITGGGSAALNSHRLSFSGPHQEREPIITRGGSASLSFRRLSFSGLQEQGPALTKGEAAALSSRRLSFRGLAQEQEPAITKAGRTRRQSFRGLPHEQGPAITKAGSTRRRSFSGQVQEQGPAITKGGTGALSSRRLSFSDSKRHMQVITMWNPASVSTVESPVESSPKNWLKLASKRWREHGSGRRILDPIENGPETKQDWRARFIDIDPDRRWPVQGW